MSDNSPFLILDQTCEEAINWVASRISSVGLRVVRTFDLQTARHDLVGCSCPHHGSQQCDCQMVVLLVYSASENNIYTQQPISIVVHGYNGQTWFTVVDTPQQRANPNLEETIRLALMSQLSTIESSQSAQTHAL